MTNLVVIKVNKNLRALAENSYSLLLHLKIEVTALPEEFVNHIFVLLQNTGNY